MVSTVGVPIMGDGTIWGFMVAAAKPGRPIPTDTEERLARFTERGERPSQCDDAHRLPDVARPRR